MTSAITGDMGYMVAMGVIGDVDGSMGGACAAEISVVLVLRDN